MSADMERIWGMDVLRLAAMFMIVVLHVLTDGGVASTMSATKTGSYLARGLEVGVNCAVDVFALASGFLLYGTRFRWGRIGGLWLQAAFYSFGISLVFLAIDPAAVGGWRALVNDALPVTRFRYWYFTAYFWMVFATPLLNAMVDRLRVPWLLAFLLSSGLFFMSAACFLPADFSLLGVPDGYGPLWLGYLYLVGAAVRKYDVAMAIPRWGAAGLFGIAFVISFVHRAASPGREDYTFPSVFLAAFALLIGFSRMKVAYGRAMLKTVSPLAFAVYLIHMQRVAKSELLIDRYGFLGKLNPFVSILGVVLVAAAFFVCGLCLEYMRVRLFALARRRIGSARAA